MAGLPDTTALDDAALLAVIASRSAKGGKDSQACLVAFSTLYDRYARLVFSIATHTLNDKHAAEEITQDVFIRVWDHADSYRPDVAQVKTWLVSIARNRVIDELRRRASRRESALVEWPEDDSSPDANLQLESPEEPVETALQRKAVRRAIAALPEDQKQILGLAFFQGFSHQQIADKLGAPLGTVKSRIRLALQKVHDAIPESY